MNKSAKQRAKSELKSRINRSHNLDDQLIAFVKFLARRAAEEDYKTLLERTNNQNIAKKVKGEEQ